MTYRKLLKLCAEATVAKYTYHKKVDRCKVCHVGMWHNGRSKGMCNKCRATLGMTRLCLTRKDI
jgi:hypothetical protein